MCAWVPGCSLAKGRTSASGTNWPGFLSRGPSRRPGGPHCMRWSWPGSRQDRSPTRRGSPTTRKRLETAWLCWPTLRSPPSGQRRPEPTGRPPISTPGPGVSARTSPPLNRWGSPFASGLNYSNGTPSRVHEWTATPRRWSRPVWRWSCGGRSATPTGRSHCSPSAPPICGVQVRPRPHAPRSVPHWR